MNKEILALIEPYMDKELREGCLLQSLKKDKYREYFRIFQNLCKDWDSPNDNYMMLNISRTRLASNEDTERLNEGELYEYKILWHYDITAVLKYAIMEWNWYYGYDETDWISIYISPEKVEIEQIPNKPLHLYTEKEQKDLLELLLKLKN